jgi:hypothetical protein
VSLPLRGGLGIQRRQHFGLSALEAYVDSRSFGTITALPTTEGAGLGSLELSGRFDFCSLLEDGKGLRKHSLPWPFCLRIFG